MNCTMVTKAPSSKRRRRSADVLLLSRSSTIQSNSGTQSASNDDENIMFYEHDPSSCSVISLRLRRSCRNRRSRTRSRNSVHTGYQMFSRIHALPSTQLVCWLFVKLIFLLLTNSAAVDGFFASTSRSDMCQMPSIRKATPPLSPLVRRVHGLTPDRVWAHCRDPQHVSSKQRRSTLFAVPAAAPRHTMMTMRMTTGGTTTTSSSTDYSGTEQNDTTSSTTATTVVETTTSTTPTKILRRPVCAYRNAATGNVWQARIDLSELHMGQELRAVIVREANSTKTKLKTGPKVWVDAGVGRYTAASNSRPAISNSNNSTKSSITYSTRQKQTKNPWKICYALLRLGGAGMKPSIARKKVTKLRQAANGFPVYVSRIYPAQGQWEVVLERPTIATNNTTAAAAATSETVSQPLQSSSQLQPGTVVRGTVERVEPYGCLVRLDGYNRPGLLHVQRVADLYGRLIKGKEGLVEAGLERRARVELQVRSNAGRGRLFLDFTDAVLQEAAQEQRMQNEARAGAQQRRNLQPTKDMVPVPASIPSSSSSAGGSDVPHISQESAVGGESNSVQPNDNDYDDDDEYDDYDEERDIEDALGLGTY